VAALFGGRCAFSGDAALLGLGRAERWALAPLIARDGAHAAERRPLVVFPESAQERLAARCRYRLDPFKAAIAGHTPVIPIALERRTDGLRVMIGEPIAPAADDGAAELRERARAAIAALTERNR
jgi:hypothetical protein